MKALDKPGFSKCPNGRKSFTLLMFTRERMNITVNNTDKSTQAGNLKELLRELNLLEKKGIAVAVNELVIQRAQWDQLQLAEKDDILVITAAAGG